MTTIESKHVDIQRSAEEVFNYLEDLNNFHELLPRDKISDFTSDGASCSFKISGMSTIGLKTVEKVPFEKLVLDSVDSPFKFTLTIHVKSGVKGGCEAFQVATLDLNPMMKMMVEKPLTNLFNHISDRLLAVNS